MHSKVSIATREEENLRIYTEEVEKPFKVPFLSFTNVKFTQDSMFDSGKFFNLF